MLLFYKTVRKTFCGPTTSQMTVLFLKKIMRCSSVYSVVYRNFWRFL